MNINQPIHNLQPSYTDMRFSKAQTVWLASNSKLTGEYIKGAEYNYSDRMWQWDWDKANKASDAIDKALDRRSPAYIQEFLRYYFDNPSIVLVHVLAGFNVSTGYPYQVYGYKKEDLKP